MDVKPKPKTRVKPNQKQRELRNIKTRATVLYLKKELGVNLTHIAEKSGLTQAYFSRWLYSDTLLMRESNLNKIKNTSESYRLPTENVVLKQYEEDKKVEDKKVEDKKEENKN